MPLGALDGIDYYYGLGVEQDYHQALVEFQKGTNSDIDALFEILIYLNGDGVAKDPARALEIWRTKLVKNGWASLTTINLRKVIDERLARPTTVFPHLSFEEIADTTTDINAAADIRARIQQNRQAQVFAAVEVRLSPGDRESWSKLKRLIGKISELDSDRVYTEYIDGTIRTAYFYGVQHLILAHFLDRSEHWLLGQPPVTADSPFNEVDKNLNTTYQKLMRSLGDEYQELIDMYQDEPETQQKYRTYEKDMVAGLREAQRAWIEYRDTWVRLLVERSVDLDPKRLEAYVKTEITKDRLSELEYSGLE